MTLWVIDTAILIEHVKTFRQCCILVVYFIPHVVEKRWLCAVDPCSIVYSANWILRKATECTSVTTFRRAGLWPHQRIFHRLRSVVRHWDLAPFYVNDHIVVPRDIASRYPYSEGGDWAGGQFGEAMDILSMLAFLAAATSKVRLLTSVMVVPYRHPVVTAKMIATIDVLSNGRVTGCGAGWMEEEFIAVGAPSFAERGKSTDEYLKIFREIWTKETPSYDGTYASFGNIAALPQPKQSPLPIWIGGRAAWL